MIGGCAGPDPRTVRGLLQAAAGALEHDDSRELYPYLDRRARAALAAIVKSRHSAAQLIEADYPAAERAAALRALGDAATTAEPIDLFAKRCTAACRAQLAQGLGAPIAERAAGDELEVTTTRGRLRLFHGRDGTWGLVWNTQALSDERLRAARDLLQIRGNAEVYRRRRALEASP